MLANVLRFTRLETQMHQTHRPVLIDQVGRGHGLDVKQRRTTPSLILKEREMPGRLCQETLGILGLFVQVDSNHIQPLACQFLMQFVHERK